MTQNRKTCIFTRKARPRFKHDLQRHRRAAPIAGFRPADNKGNIIWRLLVSFNGSLHPRSSASPRPPGKTSSQCPGERRIRLDLATWIWPGR